MGTRSILLVLLSCVMLLGCATGPFSYSDAAGSMAAASTLAETYADGCEAVLVAPAFKVDFSQNAVRYGAGVFVGCHEDGQLAELLCEQDPAGAWSCSPVRLWNVEAP